MILTNPDYILYAMPCICWFACMARPERDTNIFLVSLFHSKLGNHNMEGTTLSGIPPMFNFEINLKKCFNRKTIERKVSPLVMDY